MYQDLPTELVRPAPDNLRRRVGDVSDIVASIPTHGIIEPLVVAPQDDGTYLIVAGHRRHAAAVKAEMETVPCIVRPMTDEERVLAALIENGLRNDLRVTEEASGYFRLVEAGWKIKDLARATGRTAKHVAARLALLQLPAGVRSRVDDGELRVGEAAELLKLRHHPDLLAEVAQAVVDDEVDDIGWAVRQALMAAERQAKRAEVIAQLRESGVAVVEHDGYGLPQGLTPLGGYQGLDVDAEAHAGEECHVVVVSRDGDTRPACGDPGRHAKKGGSDLKAAKPARVVSEHEARQREEQKAVREPARAWAEFLRELLGRRLPKAGVVGLVLQAFIRSANQLPAKAACELLGLEAPPAREDYYGTRAVEELMRYAEGGDAHLQRAALALAFALAEEHMGPSWGPIGWADPTVVAHLRFLEESGYQRSEFEDERLTKAAEALEERAADRQRWRERQAEHDQADEDDADEPGEDAASEEEASEAS
jgi:ParB/RepB/Spo0J family partition protein